MAMNSIEVRNAAAGTSTRIPADCIPLGLPGDCKPNLAVMPDGEVVLAAFRSNADKMPTGYREDILLFRSHDGGRTWSQADNLGQRCNLLGREPYLTVLRDGVMLLTCHFLIAEARNTLGYCANFVHRSADHGESWTTVEVLSEPLPAGTQYGTTRNILELADGSLLHVVTITGDAGSFLWTSDDRGVTWQEQGPARMLGLPEQYPYGVFEESHMLRLHSGRILMISRVDHRHYPIPGREISMAELTVINRLLAADHTPPITSITGSDYDAFNHLKLFISDDGGATWRLSDDIGDYGMMYPSVLRLGDGRIVFTFTVRHISPPLGVRAVLGEETADGLRFDFAHNQYILDEKTPFGQHSGGGFGNTVRVDDDTLLTAYSYRDDKGLTHVEVTRWCP